MEQTTPENVPEPQKPDQLEVWKGSLLRTGRRWSKKIQDHVAKLNASQILSRAEDVSRTLEVAQEFAKAPSVLGGARLALQSSAVLADLFSTGDADDFFNDEFEGDVWCEYYTKDVQSIVAGLLVPHIKHVYKLRWGDIVIAKHKGATVGWFSSQSAFREGPVMCSQMRVLSRTVDTTRRVIRDMVWQQHSGQHLVVGSKPTTNRYGGMFDGSTTYVALDNEFVPHDSVKARKYTRYAERYLEIGKPRSIMFYGPPGTGKSTLIRTIITNLSMRTLRVRVEELNSSSESISQLVDMFEPDCMVFDDVDRVQRRQEGLLEMFESIRHKVKLILLSANWVNQFDCATIRPGRVDMIVPVVKLDRRAIETLLGPAHADLYRKVKNWPIAYINEIKTRRPIETPTEFRASLRELGIRVKHDQEVFEKKDPLGLVTKRKKKPEPDKSEAPEAIENDGCGYKEYVDERAINQVTRAARALSGRLRKRPVDRSGRRTGEGGKKPKNPRG